MARREVAAMVDGGGGLTAG
uniref:Uncharacterized protein n=1 Tax=Arundo donax TaxID=35708 RepID=A0A0A9NC51_ARUDO